MSTKDTKTLRSVVLKSLQETQARTATDEQIADQAAALAADIAGTNRTGAAVKLAALLVSVHKLRRRVDELEGGALLQDVDAHLRHSAPVVRKSTNREGLHFGPGDYETWVRELQDEGKLPARGVKDN